MKVCCCDAVGIELYVDSNLLWNEKTCTFLILNLLKEGDEQLLVILFSLASDVMWCFTHQILSGFCCSLLSSILYTSATYMQGIWRIKESYHLSSEWSKFWALSVEILECCCEHQTGFCICGDRDLMAGHCRDHLPFLACECHSLHVVAALHSLVRPLLSKCLKQKKNMSLSYVHSSIKGDPI